MLRNIYYLLIILLLVNCQNEKVVKITPDHDNYYYYEYSDGKLVLEDSTDNAVKYGNHYALSKTNLGGAHFDDLDINKKKPKKIKLQVYLDQNVTTTDVNKIAAGDTVINTILENMNIGYQVEMKVETLNTSNILTNGLRNKENIFNDLDMKFEKDVTYVFLFDKSDFFSTASAICMFTEDDVPVIFGNALLFEAPMIFVHELGHSLGLTHANGLAHKNCDAFNFMHESSIGCAFQISNRQILIAQNDSYVPPIRNDNNLIGTCDCAIGDMQGIVEGYVNSLDRNIDDTPVVSEYSKFFVEKYREELKNGKPAASIIADLENNYENEYNSLVKLNSIITLDDYVKQRVKVHTSLRRNNLARWLEHVAEDYTDISTDGMDFYNAESSFYEGIIGQIDSTMICEKSVSSLVSAYLDFLSQEETIMSRIGEDSLSSCLLEVIDDYSRKLESKEDEITDERYNEGRNDKYKTGLLAMLDRIRVRIEK